MNVRPRFQLNEARLAWGLVKHHRDLPRPNGFTTRACFVRLVFSGESRRPDHKYPVLDGPGLFSVSARDYGLEPHQLDFPDLLATLVEKMETETGDTLDGAVHLQTFPKVLGYVFNPVSFWFFHNRQGQCRVILCEVNNTFGERHFYLLSPEREGQTLNRGQLLHARKMFHVSPFFPVSGRYEFRFFNRVDHALARINYFEGNEQQLSTSVSGTLMHPNTRLWCYTLLKHGWFTVAVILKIHWQAVKLFLKGARFHRKPEPPRQPITQTEPEA